MASIQFLLKNAKKQQGQIISVNCLDTINCHSYMSHSLLLILFDSFVILGRAFVVVTHDQTNWLVWQMAFNCLSGFNP